MSHSVPVISIQHTLIFINLQEEMLLETNRDLKRKVVPSKSSNTRSIIHLRSLITFFFHFLFLLSVGGRQCNAYSIAMGSFFFCRTFPTTTATTRHELLSNKPSNSRSWFLQSFTRQCSMADEVSIIEKIVKTHWLDLPSDQQGLSYNLCFFISNSHYNPGVTNASDSATKSQNVINGFFPGWMVWSNNTYVCIHVCVL